ncbi:hypothetical protein KOR42_02630 [Thalassoglobus neptunius]|uniref:Uncharacterized protein n=1 Tax=Thalassoglobus neptunius TaxID=1938619 RepID=A0A5C5X1M1_9PLAN|nr:hypothetical protein [Thalassoglobus neptunius]TWT56907.1 hypothetical protein KOR42_02630 [Thalassoglobus neptunius]
MIVVDSLIKRTMKLYLLMIVSVALVLQPLLGVGFGDVRDHGEVAGSTCCGDDPCCPGPQNILGTLAPTCCSTEAFDSSTQVCCVPDASEGRQHASQDGSDDCPYQENSCPCCVPSITLSAILTSELNSPSLMTGKVHSRLKSLSVERSSRILRLQNRL